jgi:hypothetical protein
MGKHEVSLYTDWTMLLPSIHMAIWVPPPPPPAAAYPHVEIPVPLGWFGGVLGGHKLTSNIFHQFQKIAQDGHDCGPGITHLTWPPHDPLLLVIIALSKRKCMFGASTVVMNGIPCGVIDLTGLAPMLMCADPVSLPVQWAPTNMTNTVYVGTTLGDLIGGWVGIAVTMAIEFVVYLMAKGLAHKIGHKFHLTDPVEYLVKLVIKVVFKKVFHIPDVAKAAKKAVQKAVDGNSPNPGAASSSTMTTASPFGPSSISMAQNPDGSFNAVTSSPTSSGGRTTQTHEGLGLAAPAGNESPVPDFASAFQHAPAL